ncbi:MAG: family 10 glycosylhydrolase [Paraprevotella sp.]|nr:family 10 glycosylhydrolase [Paraprevotella sp.]
MKIQQILTLIIFYLLTARTEAMAQTDLIPSSPKRETRAVWLTTYQSLDWPKDKATSPEGIARQQDELRHILDRLQEAHFNTVLLQTRVRGSVIYPSAIEPWDACLTGTPGGSPGYDPLAFAIRECHKRGMELHAWLVTIPCFKKTEAARAGKSSVLKTHPQLCVPHGDSWYLDPGQPGTADYLSSICREIALNYDIDGIHFDYIRYPENAAQFNDKKTYRRYGKQQNLAQWRRDNVTRCVRTMYQAIKAVKPWIKVSSSPIGKFDDLSRYSSYRWNAFSAVYQDAQGWLAEGIQDMLFPMMYFRGNNFYPFAIDWQENDHGRPVIPGLGVYFLSPQEQDWPLTDITRELYFIRRIGLPGQAYFRYAFLNENHKGIFDFLRNFYYPYPALPALCKATDSLPPAIPARLSLRSEEGIGRLCWEASTDSVCGTSVRYNVYAARDADPDITSAASLIAASLDTCALPVDARFCLQYNIHFAVTSIDRFGNESRPAYLSISVSSQTDDEADSRFLPHDRTLLTVPKRQAPFLSIEDLEGRTIQTVPYRKQIRIDKLTGGIYQLRTRDKKGRSARIGFFIK